MAATWKDTTKRITLYPAPGQTGVPASEKKMIESVRATIGRRSVVRNGSTVGGACR